MAACQEDNLLDPVPAHHAQVIVIIRCAAAMCCARRIRSCHLHSCRASISRYNTSTPNTYHHRHSPGLHRRSACSPRLHMPPVPMQSTHVREAPSHGKLPPQCKICSLVDLEQCNEKSNRWYRTLGRQLPRGLCQSRAGHCYSSIPGG